jgi:hypothetical protein
MVDTTRRRKRVAPRFQRKRPPAIAREIGPRHDGPGWPTTPPREWPDDPDGGAGVREPRHPFPNMPAGAMALPEPTRPDTLDVTGQAYVP